MRPLVYIAHPLGMGPNRSENLVKATAWCAWAADHGVIPVAPWIAIATHWPETRREEGLAIDLETIAQCAEVWLCGPRVSEGMTIEGKYGLSIEKSVWRVLEMFTTEPIPFEAWFG